MSWNEGYRIMEKQVMVEKLGEIYTIEIGFAGERHCLRCPLRDKNDDTCNLMKLGDENIEYESFERQMQGCPLTFDRNVYNGEKGQEWEKRMRIG